MAPKRPANTAAILPIWEALAAERPDLQREIRERMERQKAFGHRDVTIGSSEPPPGRKILAIFDGDERPEATPRQREPWQPPQPQRWLAELAGAGRLFQRPIGNMGADWEPVALSAARTLYSGAKSGRLDAHGILWNGNEDDDDDDEGVELGVSAAGLGRGAEAQTAMRPAKRYASKEDVKKALQEVRRECPEVCNGEELWELTKAKLPGREVPRSMFRDVARDVVTPRSRGRPRRDG